MANKPVAGKGIASVNHQVAIRIATPNVNHALLFNDSGEGSKQVAIRNIIPIIKPINFVLFIFIPFSYILFIKNTLLLILNVYKSFLYIFNI